MLIFEKNLKTGETIVSVNDKELEILQRFQKDKTRFGITLRSLMIEHNISYKELAQMLCVSRAALTYWTSGKSMPRSYHLAEISRIFGVKTEDLI